MPYNVKVFDDITVWHDNSIDFLDLNHKPKSHATTEKPYLRISNNIITDEESIVSINSDNSYTIKFKARKVTNDSANGTVEGTITIGAGGACDAHVFFAVAEEITFIPAVDPESKPNR